MTIHTPTVLIALLIGYSMLVLDLLLARRSLMAQRPELRIWALGSLTVLLGFLSVLLRPSLPLGASVLLTNGVLAWGILVYTRAVAYFVTGRQGPSRCCRWVFGVGLALLTAAVVAGGAYCVLVVVASFWLAAMMGPMLWVLWHRGAHMETSLRTVMVTLVVCCLALVFRGAHAMVAPEHYGSLMQPGWVQGLTFLTAFMVVLGTGFGFLLANFERATQQMEVLASCDELTGCYNRTTTRTMLGHLLDRCRRERTPMALVLLDLDHFKRVNDEHGHPVGDRVLQQFADVVRGRLRASDVFGRMGGEEFCLGLPVTDRQGAVEVVEALRQSVEALALTGRDGRVLQVTVSAGVVAVAMANPADLTVDLEQLYSQADDLLYRAKHLGRNQIMAA